MRIKHGPGWQPGTGNGSDPAAGNGGNWQRLSGAPLERAETAGGSGEDALLTPPGPDAPDERKANRQPPYRLCGAVHR